MADPLWQGPGYPPFNVGGAQPEHDAYSEYNKRQWERFEKRAQAKAWFRELYASVQHMTPGAQRAEVKRALEDLLR